MSADGERQAAMPINSCLSQNARNTALLMSLMKPEYYRTKVHECGRNTKKLFRITNNLVGSSIDVVLPKLQSSIDLAEEFNKFFSGKKPQDSIKHTMMKASQQSYELTTEYRRGLCLGPCCTAFTQDQSVGSSPSMG